MAKLPKWKDDPVVKEPPWTNDPIVEIGLLEEKPTPPAKSIEEQVKQEYSTAAQQGISLDEARATVDFGAKEEPIGFWEAARQDWATKLPFSPIGAMDTMRVFMAMKRLDEENYELYSAREAQYVSPFGYTRYITPENLRDEDSKILTQYIEKITERERRGYSGWGWAGAVGSQMPAWMIEFFLTGGLKKVGSEPAKAFIRKHLKSRMAAGIAGWVSGATVRTTLGMPHRTVEAVLRRRLTDDPENWATSISLGWGEVFIEALSEEAGATMVKGAKAAGAGIISKLPFGKKFLGALQASWMSLSPDNTAANFVKRIFGTKGIFSPAGFDGVVGEVGEERLATLLHGLVGTEDFGAGKEAGPLARIIAGFKQDWENKYVELGVFGTIGGGQAALQQLMTAPEAPEPAPAAITPTEPTPIVPEAKPAPKAEVGKIRITDRIDRIEGVEKTFWKKGELTVYYDESVPKDAINVRVQKELADRGLRDSIKTIKLLSTEKGTFEPTSTPPVTKPAVAPEAKPEGLMERPLYELAEGEEVISKETREALKDRGYTVEEIVRLSPEEARSFAEGVVPEGRPAPTKIMSFKEWQKYKNPFFYGATNAEEYGTLENQRRNYRWYVEETERLEGKPALTVEVPPAPLAEPAGEVADYEETRKTLLGELKTVKKIRRAEREPAVARLRKRQVAKATAMKKRLIKQGVPIEEATRRSKAGFKDVAEVPEYAPPDLSVEQWRALSTKASEVYPDPTHAFENRQAQDALDKLQRGEIITDAEILLLREIVGEEVADQLADVMRRIRTTEAQKAQRKWDIVRDIIQFLKTPANYDVQFARQAFSFMLMSPVKYVRGVGRNVAGYLSKDYGEGLIRAVKENPNHRDARAHGVPFRDVGMGVEKTARLEQFRGDLPYRMAKWGKYRGPVLYRLTQPFRAWGRVLLASERGAVAAINADLQERWNKRIKKRWSRMAEEAQKLSGDEKADLIDWIEKEKVHFARTVAAAMKILVARSSTGKQLQAAANHLLWSPSFTGSRYVRPYRVLVSSGSRAYAASIIASNIGATFLVGSLMALVCNLFRDEDDQVKVELDPRSSSWNRFKVGDTWFDIGMGESQHYRFLAQFITGEVKKQSGRKVEVPRWSTIKRLVENKETALIGVIHEIATGYDLFGDPAFELPELEKLRDEGTVTAEAYADLIQKSKEYPAAEKSLITARYISEHILPFFVESFTEAAIMDGWPQATAAGAVEVFAAQASSYKTRAKTELEVMQDELARTRHGRDWMEISLPQKINITEDVHGLKEKMVQVRKERLAGEPYIQQFPTKKQAEVRERMQKAMPPAIKRKLKDLGIEVGGVGRRILDFYLNEKEFEQYISEAEKQIKTDLREHFASPGYRAESKFERREDTIKVIDNAKKTVLERLKSEWGV